MRNKPYCCKLSCEKDAEWRITYGPNSDDYTEACTDHIGELLEPDIENAVYPIKWDEPVLASDHDPACKCDEFGRA